MILKKNVHFNLFLKCHQNCEDLHIFLFLLFLFSCLFLSVLCLSLMKFIRNISYLPCTVICDNIFLSLFSIRICRRTCHQLYQVWSNVCLTQYLRCAVCQPEPSVLWCGVWVRTPSRTCYLGWWRNWCLNRVPWIDPELPKVSGSFDVISGIWTRAH